MKYEDLIVKSGKPKVEVARCKGFPFPETHAEMLECIALAGPEGWPGLKDGETVEAYIVRMTTRQAATDRANALRLQHTTTASPTAEATRIFKAAMGGKIKQGDAVAQLTALLATLTAAGADGEGDESNVTD